MIKKTSKNKTKQYNHNNNNTNNKNTTTTANSTTNTRVNNSNNSSNNTNQQSKTHHQKSNIIKSINQKQQHQSKPKTTTKSTKNNNDTNTNSSSSNNNNTNNTNNNTTTTTTAATKQSSPVTPSHKKLSLHQHQTAYKSTLYLTTTSDICVLDGVVGVICDVGVCRRNFRSAEAPRSTEIMVESPAKAETADTLSVGFGSPTATAAPHTIPTPKHIGSADSIALDRFNAQIPAPIKLTPATTVGIEKFCPAMLEISKLLESFMISVLWRLLKSYV